ncbi:MAG: gas vesicle protein GvpN [Parachlamydiaceae bacterium]
MSPIRLLHKKKINDQAYNNHVLLEPSEDFVVTAYIDELTERSLAYLEVGYSIHFAGPAGTGKTTLAFHVASQLNRPITIIHGDDEYKGSSLIGQNSGYKKQKLVDNFVHSVMKTEEQMSVLWIDQRLTLACKHGHTLIYDEFTRSNPEANNVFLSILEEKILNLQHASGKNEGFLHVHPDFRVIFTSNPEEYAGTHKTQDALMDRMITIQLNQIDREMELAVTLKKAGPNLNHRDGEIIVDIVRDLRAKSPNKCTPSIRASIAIARILAHRGGKASLNDPIFRIICRDVLSANKAKIAQNGHSIAIPHKVDEVLEKVIRRFDAKQKIS